MLTRTSETAASLAVPSPVSGNSSGAGEARRQANLSIGASCEPHPCGLPRAEQRTGKAAAPNLPTYLIPTIRNCQGLSSDELAETLQVPATSIDAIRALGHYSGGDVLTSSLIARDLNSEVQL